MFKNEDFQHTTEQSSEVPSDSTSELPAEAFPEVSTDSADPDAGFDVTPDMFASPDTSFDVINGANLEFDSPKKKHKAGKIVAIVLGVLVLALGAVYVGGAIYFGSTALPNTTLADDDISLEAFSSVAEQVAGRAKDFSTKVTGTDFSLDLTASDMGLTFDQDSYAQSLSAQQNIWAWPLAFFQTQTLSASESASFDSSKLEKLLSEAITKHNESATQPTNATIGYVESEGGYAVIPEVAGSALDSAATVSYVEKQLLGLPASIKLDDTCYVQPTVTSDDANLAQAVTNANTFLKADIPLTLAGMEAGSVTKAEISGWIVLDENNNATLDETKLAEWVKNNIAAKFDTAGSARTYTRPDGKTVSVDANSSHWGNYYGWITDEATLVSQLAEAIKSGSTETIDIPTKQTASAVPDSGGRDWGNRYIDCDLSEQHVRLYDASGSLIWESDCVTGKTSDGHDTPTGVYVLNGNKQSGDVELRGQIDPSTGEPEYISHVKYWMPFIGNSWAFHDADWRSSFGGTIYQYSGSHGCVNLPPAKAADLYNLCQVGDVVVVHY